METRTNKLGGLPYLEVWVVTIAMPFICRFFAANWAPEIVCCGMLGHGKFVVGKLSPEYLFGSILGPSRPGNTGEKSGRAILYWHFHVFKPKYVSQERSFHAAVVVGENIIIVGDRDRHMYILNIYWTNKKRWQGQKTNEQVVWGGPHRYRQHQQHQYWRDCEKWICFENIDILNNLRWKTI